eukprot:1761160-Prymnesium_polylepis.2
MLYVHSCCCSRSTLISSAVDMPLTPLAFSVPSSSALRACSSQLAPPPPSLKKASDSLASIRAYSRDAGP